MVIISAIATSVSILSQHFEICRILINSILGEEVNEYTGSRYRRDGPKDNRYSRYGFNSGSVKLGAEKVRVDVPRVFDKEEKKTFRMNTFRHSSSSYHCTCNGCDNNEYQYNFDFQTVVVPAPDNENHLPMPAWNFYIKRFWFESHKNRTARNM